jgi:Na+-translocating ferredoxin:NAD+ oxidoreductase RnfD subunit
MLSVVALAAGAQLFFCLVPELLTRLLFGAKFLAIADLLPLYGLAMLLLACTQTLALYFLAVGRRAFALAIVGACVLEIMLIAGRHTDIAYIVQDVLLANLALLLVLVLCWQRIWQKERIQGIRQGGV